METLAQTPLQSVLNAYQSKHSLKFTPNKAFYDRVQINRIRFWQLVKGKAELSVSEVRALSEFFSIPLTDLL